MIWELTSVRLKGKNIVFTVVVINGIAGAGLSRAVLMCEERKVGDGTRNDLMRGGARRISLSPQILISCELLEVNCGSHESGRHTGSLVRQRRPGKRNSMVWRKGSGTVAQTVRFIPPHSEGPLLCVVHSKGIQPMTGRGSEGPTHSEFGNILESIACGSKRIEIQTPHCYGWHFLPKLLLATVCVAGTERESKWKPLGPSECRRKPEAGSPRPTTSWLPLSSRNCPLILEIKILPCPACITGPLYPTTVDWQRVRFSSVGKDPLLPAGEGPGRLWVPFPKALAWGNAHC